MRLATRTSWTFLILLVASLLGAAAHATDVQLLSPGQKVYKRGAVFGTFSPNVVVVERIDTEGNRALVSDGEGGVSEWVSADALYTGDELSSARVTDAIDGLAKASERQRNAGIREISSGCMADYDFQQVLSQHAAESQHGISNETMCTCIATNIVDKEPTETVGAIAADFAQVVLIGKERFFGYMNECAAAAPTETAAASVDVETPLNDPVIDLDAAGTPAAAGEVTMVSDAATDASAAAAGAVDAAALAVAPAPAASAESPASPPQPPWFWAMVGAGGLLAVGGLFAVGVLVGRKMNTGSRNAGP
jgi:hypothetical protein